MCFSECTLSQSLNQAETQCRALSLSSLLGCRIAVAAGLKPKPHPKPVREDEGRASAPAAADPALERQLARWAGGFPWGLPPNYCTRSPWKWKSKENSRKQWQIRIIWALFVCVCLCVVRGNFFLFSVPLCMTNATTCLDRCEYYIVYVPVSVPLCKAYDPPQIRRKDIS